LAGLAAAALLLVVITPAASIFELSMLLDTLLKSHYRSNNGEKRECISNSNNILVLGGGLFIKGFYKCFFSGNILNTIKGPTRLIYLFSVVGIAILNLQSGLTLKAIRFYKYYNIS
jgi:hypothetical protein